MNQDENDALWRLLGKARAPRISSFFTNKVLRLVRETGERRPTILEWLRRKWILPLAAGTCLAVLAFFALKQPAATPAVDPLEEMAVAVADAPEIMPSLNDLLASEEHSIWLEADPSSLY
jgi:hypothetical protein